MSKTGYDVIIVGGGIMGCSTAYYLAKTDPKLKVAVVERDPTYESDLHVPFHGQHQDPIHSPSECSGLPLCLCTAPPI